MAEFAYSGVDRAGKRLAGKLEAQNEGEIRMALRAQGIRPTRIVKAEGGMAGMLKSSGFGGSVPLESLVAFTRQFQVLISSGIPIVQGLDILAESQPNRAFKFILDSMRDKVSSGSYLWEAMSQYPKAFPRIYVSLVRAGESSGSVDQILKRLSKYLEDSDRLRKTIKGAMMYPIVVVTIGIGVIALMLIFVIPKFAELLKGGGQELPGPTAFVLNMSNALVSHIVPITLGTATSIFLLIRWAKSEEGKAVIDRVFFKAPIFGNIMQKGGTAKFARTMQTLLMAGVNLIDAVDICKATVGNAVIETAVGKIRQEIEGGKTLGMVVGTLGVFPPMANQMISIGESTGNLDGLLGKIADFYEEEVQVLVAGLTKLIEPLVIVFLGGAVGGLLVAMYLPIFKIAGSM